MRTDTTENSQPYVIIVEDDERLADLTAEYLRSNGIKVEVINDGSVAISAIIMSVGRRGKTMIMGMARTAFDASRMMPTATPMRERR